MLINKFYKGISIYRAISDLRNGLPIVIQDTENCKLIVPIETGNYEVIKSLSADCNLDLVLSKYRVAFISKSPTIETNISIPLERDISLEDLISLSGLDLSKTSDLLQSKLQYAKEASCIESAAVELALFAEIVPSLVTTNIKLPIDQNFCIINTDDVRDFPINSAHELKMIAQSPMILLNAQKSHIYAFQSQVGGYEHYAIIINDPFKDKAPLVRLHSSCYTGDLLASLRCDCRDQLQNAISFMGQTLDGNNEFHGGIILYLMQEGRGIGLANKIKTYNLQQNQELDTVDANRVLGFPDDARNFLSASIMLKYLKINTISLLSNNPKKSSDITSYGITVDKMVNMILPTNQHNESYLNTKKIRMKHNI